MHKCHNCVSLVVPDLRCVGDLKITSTSTERQKRSQNLAPVLVIIPGKSLVFSRKIITSTDFYRYCAPDASAPVVVINQSPRCGPSSTLGQVRLSSQVEVPSHAVSFLMKYCFLCESTSGMCIRGHRTLPYLWLKCWTSLPKGAWHVRVRASAAQPNQQHP